MSENARVNEPITSRRLAQNLLKANLMNLGRRVKEGKVLTAGELTLVKEALSEMDGGAQAPGEIGADGWVRTQVELAEVLGVERKTVQRWLKETGNPGSRSDGRYNVSEWRSWAAANGKKLNEVEALPSQTVLRTKNLLLQNERLEFELAVRRKDYVATADVEKETGDMVMQAKKVLLALPSSLAPQVVGLTVPEAEKVLKESIREALEQLHANPLGKDPAAEVPLE